MYTGIAVFSFCTAIAFWLLFHHYDKDEEKMYALDRDVPELTHQGFKEKEEEAPHHT